MKVVIGNTIYNSKDVKISVRFTEKEVKTTLSKMEERKHTIFHGEKNGGWSGFEKQEHVQALLAKPIKLDCFA